MFVMVFKERISRHTTRIRRPRALGGKLRRNLARTAPLLPCARVTLPHMIRTRFKRFWPGTKVLLETDKWNIYYVMASGDGKLTF